MAGVLLLSCSLLAVAGVISVQSATPPVRRDAQQLTEEPLREKKSACKSDDGLGAVVAHLVSELSSLKVKQYALETELQSTKSELHASQAKMDTKVEELSLLASTVKRRPGSSFVRWGRKICPNNTTLVYSGIAGGKHYTHTGGGTNRLCLTRTPHFDSTAKPAVYGLLYGAEYELIPGHHNHEVPCSVCLAPQSTTIMVPATLTCPPGWTPQYTGHLVSQHHAHQGDEYVCLDGSPEDDSSGVRDDNGLLFYYVVTVCGSLPCPPYINDKVVTCVVCSK